MPTGTPNISGYRREWLASGWELTCSPAGVYDGPQAVARAPLQWSPAHAPSTVASCLRAAGTWSLDAPSRRFDSDDWWYRLRLDAPRGQPHEEHVLGFDGLATLADVWLNGTPLLSSDNMFLAHERLIDAQLPPQSELLIRFRALDRALEEKRPRPRWRAPMVENQQLRWFRATLLGRTPGWSPPAAPVGPWRAVWLETRTGIRCKGLSLHTRVADTRGWLRLNAVLEPIGGNFIRGATCVITSDTGQRHTIPLRRTSGTDSYSVDAEIPDVALWWPHTHGTPALYEAQLLVEIATGELQIQLGRVGFRTVELDTRGGDFALHVNGVPIFCRGACWTPTDVVALDTSTGDAAVALGRQLEQVRTAGLNMLRVGGAMVYESDAFLDLCDALGILLWQDFMFANMDYPHEDPAFIASVTEEARQQLARLASHPCLAVLCGNSEGQQQAAMWGASRANWSSPLFDEQLPRLALEHCPDVPYCPSSAHGGSFPHQGNTGTTSYYGVGAYLRPLEDARRAEIRFAAECLAFANVPEESTLARLPGGPGIRCHHPTWKARTPRDLGAGWDFDDVRDHYLALLFGIDPRELRYADHDRYLALSRVVSGEVMAAVLGEWRRKRSTCHGALLWFWRDLWCGSGWGVVDALGTPKAAYHYLRRAARPVSVTISDEGGNGLYLHVVNEPAAVLVASLELQLFRDGETNVGTATRSLTLNGRETLEIAAASLFDNFTDLSYAYRFGPPAHDLVVATLTGVEGRLAQAFHFIRGRSAARELDVGLGAIATRCSDSTFELELTTRRFAQSITIETDGWEPEDNYFHLAPGSSRTLVLRRRAVALDRPLRGRVQALNAHKSAKIDLRA